MTGSSGPGPLPTHPPEVLFSRIVVLAGTSRRSGPRLRTSDPRAPDPAPLSPQEIKTAESTGSVAVQPGIPAESSLGAMKSTKPPVQRPARLRDSLDLISGAIPTLSRRATGSGDPGSPTAHEPVEEAAPALRCPLPVCSRSSSAWPAGPVTRSGVETCTQNNKRPESAPIRVTNPGRPANLEPTHPEPRSPRDRFQRGRRSLGVAAGRNRAFVVVSARLPWRSSKQRAGSGDPGSPTAHEPVEEAAPAFW